MIQINVSFVVDRQNEIYVHAKNNLVVG